MLGLGRAAACRLSRGATSVSFIPSSGIFQNFFRDLSSDSDSHDDFKAQLKPQQPGGVVATIEEDISKHKVFLYMKGVPEAPQCGFSMLACQILNHYGVTYGSRNVLADPEIREGIKKFTSWPTIPQVFVDGEFVGGSDILKQMHENGELKKLFGGKA
ncbi:unnamed protein product [Ostreobium quekettii]|uniref:Glutaredoxin domain-containing protein n=1 Tax=Ostreobium quekettii TaxID=121088 RepID=A0A8S1J6J9_9CHLO|nr:unnamed protein product [Ostreobium quekettii]|eukprot:evm.model.scf_1552.3 EVM.evm.TU.scf_1552.3   scf_1552:24446-28540(-)